MPRAQPPASPCRVLQRALLTAVVGFVFAAGASGLAVAKTNVVHWSPFVADGSLRAGLLATPKFGGDCWIGSDVVHRGYRCAAGNFVYDPCFGDPRRNDAVVCVTDPFTTHVLRLRVSGRMNNSESARAGVVWAVRLASGLECTFAGGATSADSAGRRLNYFCRHSRAALWGDPIRTGATWHIRLTPSASAEPERLVAIRTAYIGRTS